MYVLAKWHDVPRDEFPLALVLIGEMVRPGRFYTMQVYHDDKCPCAGDRVPLAACTCSHVNIGVAELR